MPIVLDGSQGISTPMYAGSITSNPVTPSVNMKNRLINGNMTIDQRNAGASVTPADGAYTLDRWVYLADQASKCTIQQNAGSVTPPAGFSNYLGVTSTAATTITTSQQFSIVQRVEGFNMIGLNWGSANAQTVTLSFWVRSSLTGTFGGVLRNDAGNYNYPFTYTISSANTWEQKSVTITGATTGTWTINNGRCLQIAFSLGAGATLSGTAGAWTSSNFWSVTGATQVLATNGATFYLTGVQLEVGSTATSFDTRSYGTELALAQRYYYKTFPAAGTKILTTGGNCEGTTTAYGAVSFPVTMRTAPSSLEQSGTASDYVVFHSATSTTCSAVPTFNSATTANIGSTNVTVASGLTANRPANIGTNSANGYLAWSAEL